MAARYLIGTGARNWADPNNWSLTSGGAPYQPASGTERIINGSFDTTSNWVSSGYWNIPGDGFAYKIASPSVGTSYMSQTCTITAGVWYMVKLNFTEISGSFNLTNEAGSTLFNGHGTYVSYAVGETVIYLQAAVTTTAIRIYGTLAATCKMTSFSIQEIDTISPDATTPCIFDQNSGVGDVTLNANAVCASFNSVALTSIVRVVSSVYTFSNYGDLTLNGTLSKFAFTGTAYYYQKGTGNITTNGNLFLALNRLYIDGVGITVTNADDMNVGNDIYHTNGAWITNDKNIYLKFYNNVVSGTKTLTLGSSNFTCTQFIPGADATRLTFNYNTSTIILSGLDSLSIFAVSTVYNLTFIGNNTINAKVNLSNITVENNLTVNGFNNTTNRLIISPLNIGTTRTITCNGTVTASNVDFRDIVLAGTCNKDLSAITGGSGDCGGNSGIIFTTAQPQYFKKYASTANVGDAANWFSDLALTVAGRVPLPQDLGSKFLATSFNQTCTVSCNVPRIPCLDLSEVVNTVTWSLANAIEVYGSYVLGANITQSGNYIINLCSRIEALINLYNKTIYASQSIYLSRYKLNSNLNVFQSHTFYGGYSFDFNDFDFNGKSLQYGSGVNFIYLGNGIISVSEAVHWGFAQTLYSEGSTIVHISTGASNYVNYLAGKTFNKIVLSGNHTGFYDIVNNGIISELIIDSGRKVRFTAGTTQTIGKATIGANVTLDCITASTYTLALADITTAENANIKGCIAPVSKFFAEANSVDSGSNTNVVFGDYFTPQEIMIENRIN